MYEYRYTVDENNDDYDDAFVIRRMRQIDFDDKWQIESLAKDCAGDYYDNHDGWDYRSWINGNTHIDLTIWENEETKHTFQVEVEFDPSFIVRRSA
jgi:hypothetical protein